MAAGSAPSFALKSRTNVCLPAATGNSHFISAEPDGVLTVAIISFCGTPGTTPVYHAVSAERVSGLLSDEKSISILWRVTDSSSPVTVNIRLTSSLCSLPEKTGYYSVKCFRLANSKTWIRILQVSAFRSRQEKGQKKESKSHICDGFKKNL
ncbi:MAG: hypothetical protein AB9888_07715 [Bacteroidales bacterium]